MVQNSASKAFRPIFSLIRHHGAHISFKYTIMSWFDGMLRYTLFTVIIAIELRYDVYERNYQSCDNAF